MNNPLVTIIIPSWDNYEYLRPAVVSLLTNQTTKGLFEILVINNGHPQSCDFLKGHKQVRVINAGRNLGWEGGIDLGMKNSSSEFVCFFNDDAYIPTSSSMWLNFLLRHFRDPKVGAVGPSSNVVMGWQNIFAETRGHVFETKFLIGFCVLMRRRAFEEIGGMDLELPGGDDLDWSIRLRDAGYKLLIDRSTFVFHHGFKTGERIYGNPNSPQGWNSYEKTEKTNLALIKKHGFKKWWELMRSTMEEPKTEWISAYEDREGDVIRGLVKKDKVILDLGCGAHKTVKNAIGVDLIPKGQRIPTLDGDPISDADIQADVSKAIPVDNGSCDAVIARHVLEHMIDPLSALELWMDKLKPGGRLILALPNHSLHNTIPMNSEHLHAYSPASSANLLHSMGMKDLNVIDPNNSVSFIIVGTKV